MVLEIENLVKRYNGNLAVDNVNMKIKNGEIFGLLGPNGAGKTTIINSIIGLTQIDSGVVKIFEKDFIKNEMEIKKDIGVVPQDIAVFEDLSALENVEFFGKLYKLKGADLKLKVKQALEFTGLWDKRKIYPKKFSGGMKRRLNIACAIVHQPKLIIMDEPTVGIDPQSRKHILNSVKILNERGATVIYTSHYMEEVEELCSYITIMDNGKIIADGTKESLKELVSNENRMEINLTKIENRITDVLKKIEGVKEVIIEDDKLVIVSNREIKNAGEIINNILKMDMEIVSINFEEPTLENVFLTLTGRKLRD
ncbi:MAG: ABC transporter ATP-binding protein [Clostridiales bacterium]